MLRDLRELALDEDVVLVVDDGSGTYHFRDADFRSPDNLFIDASSSPRTSVATPARPSRFSSFARGQRDTAGQHRRVRSFTVTGRDIVSFVHVDGVGYVRVQDGEVHRTREERRWR